MTEYSDMLGPMDSLSVTSHFHLGGMNFTCRGGGTRIFVNLSNDSVRALRDQITAHLGGDSEKPLPVGTIVAGKGLSEMQKAYPPDDAKLRSLRQALMESFRWSYTAEGDSFWRSVRERVDNMIDSVAAEGAKLKSLLPTSVATMTVSTTGSMVDFKSDAQHQFLSAQEAKDLAAALLKHAGEAGR